jgi:hypothetical protein
MTIGRLFPLRNPAYRLFPFDPQSFDDGLRLDPVVFQLIPPVTNTAYQFKQILQISSSPTNIAPVTPGFIIPGTQICNPNLVCIPQATVTVDGPPTALVRCTF